MKRRRNFFIIVVLIVASIAAIPFVLHYQAKARLAAYKKELIAAGEKLTIAELIPQKPDGENGAQDLRSAAVQAKMLAAINPPAMIATLPGKAEVGWQEAEVIDEIYYPNYSQKITTNIWPELERQMVLHTADLAEMRQALLQPTFYIPLDYQQGFRVLLPHLIEIKHAEQGPMRRLPI